VPNIRPTAQLPTEQAAVTTDKPSTPTGQPKEQDHAVHTPLTQQNGNDQEDIFSPLKESMFCIVIFQLLVLCLRPQVVCALFIGMQIFFFLYFFFFSFTV